MKKMKDKPKYTEKQIEKIKSDSIRLAILYLYIINIIRNILLNIIF